MLKPQGYAVWTNPEGKSKERDTITCSHCNAVVFVEPGISPSDVGGFCRLCMRNICGPCADEGGCDPFEKQMERMEAKDKLRRSIVG